MSLSNVLVLEYSCKFCALLLLVDMSILLPVSLDLWLLQSIDTTKSMSYNTQGYKYHALSVLNTRKLSLRTYTSLSNSNYLSDLCY